MPDTRLAVFAALCAIALCACDRTQGTPPQPASTPTASSAPSLAAPPSTAPSARLPDTPASALDASPPPAANPALVAARPYKLGVPAGLDDGKPHPLVLFLHGYGATGSVFESALGVGTVAAARKFVYAIPDGTPDSKKLRFWNASDACCNFEGAQIDDVAYLQAVIADAMSKRAIDPKRVFVVGFSNGGFMAHRLACESADRIAGIASIAGAAWKDASKCHPSGPVTILQIHGDVDPAVPYGGGYVLGKTTMAQHPAARDTVSGWAGRNKCAPTLLPGRVLDLEDKLDGSETVTARFDGCADSAVELWTVQGGNHFVSQKPRAIEAVVAFLMAHPKR